MISESRCQRFGAKEENGHVQCTAHITLGMDADASFYLLGAHTMRHYNEEFHCKILQQVSTETADTLIYLPLKESTSRQKSKTKQN